MKLPTRLAAFPVDQEGGGVLQVDKACELRRSSIRRLLDQSPHTTEKGFRQRTCAEIIPAFPKIQNYRHIPKMIICNEILITKRKLKKKR
jgi:hypothetical protein